MQFNSIAFLIFFPAVAALHYALPPRSRWMLLLPASYLFYMWWNPAYIVLILASTAVDYSAGLYLGRTGDPARRKLCLAASLTANLGLLFLFKYFNFFNSAAAGACAAAGLPYGLANLDVLLPVGISFYTFQTMGYTIDVYRRRVAPERHPGLFATYVAFFPQLVAGPIERAANLLPQLKAARRFDHDRAVSGAWLVLWGFFQKVVIADRLAIVVDRVYGDPQAFSGPSLLLATYFFAFQILCDFSGYTDIARGTARILGIELMANFHAPYLATSVRDFWRRWHISLTSWFRDYLYVPLGGNRVSGPRWAVNIMIVFLLSGLWHGASWTFLAWGALHGTFLLGEHVTAGWRERFAARCGLAGRPGLRAALDRLFTFHLVLLAWVFFRAPSAGGAVRILSRLFDVSAGRTVWPDAAHGAHFAICFALILLLLAVQRGAGVEGLLPALGRRGRVFRWAVYLLMTLTVLDGGVSQMQPFIYFQF